MTQSCLLFFFFFFSKLNNGSFCTSMLYGEKMHCSLMEICARVDKNYKQKKTQLFDHLYQVKKTISVSYVV